MKGKVPQGGGDSMMGAGAGSAVKLVLCSAGTGRACGENGGQVLTNWVTPQTPPSASGDPKAGWLRTVCLTA